VAPTTFVGDGLDVVTTLDQRRLARRGEVLVEVELQSPATMASPSRRANSAPWQTARDFCLVRTCAPRAVRIGYGRSTAVVDGRRHAVAVARESGCAP
jgi:hypothetical protein